MKIIVFFTAYFAFASSSLGAQESFLVTAPKKGRTATFDCTGARFKNLKEEISEVEVTNKLVSVYEKGKFTNHQVPIMRVVFKIYGDNKLLRVTEKSSGWQIFSYAFHSKQMDNTTITGNVTGDMRQYIDQISAGDRFSFNFQEVKKKAPAANDPKAKTTTDTTDWLIDITVAAPRDVQWQGGTDRAFVISENRKSVGGSYSSKATVYYSPAMNQIIKREFTDTSKMNSTCILKSLR